MTARALRGHVIELFAALDCSRLLTSPRIGRRHDGSAGLLLLPLGREGLDVLNDVAKLVVGHVPLQHRGAVQTLFDDALEVFVVGERAALDRGKLELALREVARRGTKSERRRTAPVALVAVTRATVVRVRFTACFERLGGNVFTAERHRLGKDWVFATDGSSGRSRENQRAEYRGEQGPARSRRGQITIGDHRGRW